MCRNPVCRVCGGLCPCRLIETASSGTQRRNCTSSWLLCHRLWLFRAQGCQLLRASSRWRTYRPRGDSVLRSRQPLRSAQKSAGQHRSCSNKKSPSDSCESLGLRLPGSAPLWTTTLPIRFSHESPVSHPPVTFSRRPGRTRALTPKFNYSRQELYADGVPIPEFCAGFF